MSITAWDIKEAAFASDTKDVEELILANKGASDIGALAQAVNLRSLSLAFNSLSGLSGLAPLTRLQSLNVSHNQLASLKGLQGLSCLVSLNASHNRVVSLAPLSGLTALADLWLQNNALAAPAELSVLAGLPGLQRLAIANNPVIKALPPDNVRLVALRLCHGLRLVDGRPVEAAERAISDALDVEALLEARPAAPGSAPAATSSAGSYGLLGPHAGSVDRTHSSGSDSTKTRSGRGGSTGRRLSNGSTGLATPESRLPSAGARRPARSSSYDAMSDNYSPTSICLQRTHKAAPDDSQPSAAVGGSDDVDASSQPRLETMASFSSAISATSSRAGALRGGRRPPLPSAPRPAAQLQGSQFQAVLDALPRFDTAKLPARYSGAQSRSRPGGATPPAPAARPPPDAHVVEYEAKYPVQRGGGRAVVVRRDGSAAAFWPGGDMAVTVDADYNSPALPLPAAPSDPGVAGDGDGGSEQMAEAAPRCSYKLMAMYRAGGVAVSWDAQGGFVQYPSGGLMLMYSRVTGSGTCYSPSGDITRRWRDTDAAAPADSTPVISLPFPLAVPRTPTPPPPPPPSHIDMQLDPHLGVRFLASSRTVELYLCCESVRYRLRCGRNTPGEVWEPPAGRGDSAAGGGGGNWPMLASPDGTLAHSTRPATGEDGGAGTGGADADGSLPPPSFLRNLARQGGAGTHKPAGGGASSKQAAPGASASTTGQDNEAVDVGGIASIAAGLQALTEGLQALLARDSREAPKALPEATEGPGSSTAPGPAPKLSPAKGRRGPGAGSGVSAVRALAAGTEAASSTMSLTEAGAATRGSAPVASTRLQRDVPTDAPGTSFRPESSLQCTDGRATARATAVQPRRMSEISCSDSAAQGAGSGALTAGRLNTESGPGPPAKPGPSASGLLRGLDAVAQEFHGSGHGDIPEIGADSGDSNESENGGGSSRPALDSGVAAQLAAARKLAADSLAAAMAAANAAAAVGSQG